jgi:hypothetical protein
MLARFFLAAVLAAGLAFAQRGGGGGGRGDDEGGGGGMGGGVAQVRHLTKQETIFSKLKLNREQKEEATKILAAAMEKAAPARDLLVKGRIAIANSITGKASEDDLRTVLRDYTAVSATMTGIEAAAFGKLYALLKPNQQSKAPQTFELLAEVLGGAGPGGGPSGGMGGGSGRGRGGQGRGEGRR